MSILCTTIKAPTKICPPIYFRADNLGRGATARSLNCIKGSNEFCLVDLKWANTTTITQRNPKNLAPAPRVGSFVKSTGKIGVQAAAIAAAGALILSSGGCGTNEQMIESLARVMFQGGLVASAISGVFILRYGTSEQKNMLLAAMLSTLSVGVYFSLIFPEVTLQNIFEESINFILLPASIHFTLMPYCTNDFLDSRLWLFKESECVDLLKYSSTNEACKLSMDQLASSNILAELLGCKDDKAKLLQLLNTSIWSSLQVVDFGNEKSDGDPWFYAPFARALHCGKIVEKTDYVEGLARHCLLYAIAGSITAAQMQHVLDNVAASALNDKSKEEYWPTLRAARLDIVTYLKNPDKEHLYTDACLSAAAFVYEYAMQNHPEKITSLLHPIIHSERSGLNRFFEDQIGARLLYWTSAPTQFVSRAIVELYSFIFGPREGADVYQNGPLVPSFPGRYSKRIANRIRTQGLVEALLK